MTTVLITGSCGLIGSEAARFYDRRAKKVIGVDNNARAGFFGPDGDTSWRRRELEQACARYTHVEADVRDRQRIDRLVADARPDLVVHCAAQPSHDLAARIPFADFETNALGTLNLLEAARRHAPDTVFVFLSTNKVYGDGPNRIALQELERRWDFADSRFIDGIGEDFPVDQSTHSLFGASKLAADVLVQEYGRYFSMKTVCLRGGCLTGTGHSSSELHGYLAYLFKAAAVGRHYTIFGYRGKQVRDQIHSRDVLTAIDSFFHAPRCAAVYNIGGGKENSVSILESIDRIEQLLGWKVLHSVSEQERIGDHICYYSDLTRFRKDFPKWELSTGIDQLFEEFAAAALVARKSSIDKE